jgi:hypothetical protein
MRAGGYSGPGHGCFNERNTKMINHPNSRRRREIYENVAKEVGCTVEDVAGCVATLEAFKAKKLLEFRQRKAAKEKAKSHERTDQ